MSSQNKQEASKKTPHYANEVFISGDNSNSTDYIQDKTVMRFERRSLLSR